MFCRRIWELNWMSPYDCTWMMARLGKVTVEPSTDFNFKKIAKELHMARCTRVRNPYMRIEQIRSKDAERQIRDTT